MKPTAKSTLTQHMRNIAILFEHSTSTFMIPAKKQSGNQGGGHTFRIVHLTLTVFLMMYGFQEIVTQTERHDNFVVHGLTPPEVRWAISPSMWGRSPWISIGGNLG